MELKLSQIVEKLGGELRGDDLLIAGCAGLQEARAGDISFLAGAKHAGQARASLASALIVKDSEDDGFICSRIVTRDPLLYFARLAALFHPGKTAIPGIHPTAIIASNAVIHPDAQIEAGVIIGDRVRIGAATRIGAGSVIGDDVLIGEHCLLHPRVTIYHDCSVGDRVILHSGCVIGSDGFGNAWAGDHWEKIPQFGRAIIGNDVEIGANTTIDRGAASDTVVAEGCRIDNLVQIAHNVRLGRHTAIAAKSGVAGSTHIGDFCLIGGNVAISGHLQVADRVTVMGGSNVASDIREAGVYAGVTPAIPHSKWLRNAVHWRHLDDLAKKIRQLEKQIAALTEKGE
ncbi:UDP-3-O-(3-hydroxymyristoyl)glucosamine N-acyltransferase [Chitinilyticum litopenaei]|uniref:UDP-3-O-(3-hydroxymyristoyl)glucosamine N-acyltransferase n=1 Tax=Chitinilyticum litopenaei TaxID=1121276 RepID=UPI0003FFE9D8|nr:UDP-3-O-(3-hydroxymyristoyl)glucosamine N-acyltransferase [Chitinilyticum litopenaei]